MEIGDTKGATRHLTNALVIREELGEDTSDITAQLDSLKTEVSGSSPVNIDNKDVAGSDYGSEDHQDFASHSSYSQEDAEEYVPQKVGITTEDEVSRSLDNEEEINDPIANLISDAGEVLADEGLREEADECCDMASVSTACGNLANIVLYLVSPRLFSHFRRTRFSLLFLLC